MLVYRVYVNRPFNCKTGIAHAWYHAGWDVTPRSQLGPSYSICNFYGAAMKLNEMEITVDSYPLLSGFGVVHHAKVCIITWSTCWGEILLDEWFFP